MKKLSFCAVGNDYGITDGEEVIAVFSDPRHPGEAEPNASRALLAAIMLMRAPFFLRALEGIAANPVAGEEKIDPVGLKLFRELIERARL